MKEQSLWTLWRQDDNGNSAIVESDLSRKDAEHKLEELEYWGHKQLYWMEPSQSGEKPALNLLVIRVRCPETSRAFYEGLGLEFEKHQHGDGESHYAAEAPGFVFEIYPARDGAISSHLRLGFTVTDPEALIGVVTKSEGTVVTDVKDSPWGRRAVVQDPDGIRVELLKASRS